MTNASKPETAESAPASNASPRPRFLLREMRSSCATQRIWKWTLPAFAGRLPDGRTYNTCPSAGICKDLCYARTGTFRFSNVLRAHQNNLQYVLDEPQAWEEQMTEELKHPRYHPKGSPAHVRVHDSGDFFHEDYLEAWLRIFRATPDVVFYSYTKMVELFERRVRPDPPANFRYRYSYGGTQDELIVPGRNHADVFPDEESLEAAGYTSQAPSDLRGAYGPETLGIPANNIAQYKRRQGSSTFRALQRAANAEKRARQEKRNGPASRRPKAD
ncbi:GP88 family protein [Streptomyces nigrescens]|uniref:GP88 family protein n=1 Tax=Streptomyces nigrescens TaxID=1920 RepID=UPI0036F4C9EB